MQPTIKNFACLFIAAICLFLASCKDKCPESVVIANMHTPAHVEASKAVYTVDTLRFVSENGEVLSFIKTKSRNNEVVRKSLQVVPCSTDENASVDILFDSEESDYEFKSANGSSIKITYYPRISYHLDTYDQSRIDDLKATYYIGVTIRLVDYNTNVLSALVALWADQQTIGAFDKKLNGPYSIDGTTYNDVSYWSYTTSSLPQFLYIKNYELIGFVDDRAVRWIKK